MCRPIFLGYRFFVLPGEYRLCNNFNVCFDCCSVSRIRGAVSDSFRKCIVTRLSLLCLSSSVD